MQNIKIKFFDTYEAHLINNYLRLINNQQDDIALVSVLSSNMFKVSFDDLSKIRIANVSKKHFYEAVNQYVSENKASQVSIKINELFEHLAEFRAMLNYLSVPNLIKEVVEKIWPRKLFVITTEWQGASCQYNYVN